MSKNIQLFLLKEITWLLLAAIFTVLFLLPVYDVISFDFVKMNGLLAILCAYYFRYILFKSQLPYLNFLPVEILLAVTNIVLFFFILLKIQEVQVLFDNYTMDIFFDTNASVSGEDISSTFLFFKKEFLLLSVGALVLIAVFELRLLSSLLNRIKTMK